MTSLVKVYARPAHPFNSVLVTLTNEDGTKQSHLIAAGNEHTFYVFGTASLTVAESELIVTGAPPPLEVPAKIQVRAEAPHLHRTKSDFGI